MDKRIDWGRIWDLIGKQVAVAVIVAVLVLLGYKGVSGPIYESQGVTHLSGLAVSGPTTLTGAVTTGGGLTVGTIAAVGTWGRLTAATSITVTDGAVFTPTKSYQPITSAGTVTPTLSTTGYSAGYVLTLVNGTDTTVNLADAGTLKLSAAAALGQYDTLTLLFDGTNWLELSRSDN